MKVLIIKISSLGDIIHTLPAITDASKIIPNVSFDWIIEKTFSEIPTWHPAVNQIIPIQLRSLKKKWFKLHLWKEYLQCITQIKKKYDIVIDAQGLLKTSVFITKFANGTKHGMDYTSSKEPLSSKFYDYCHNIHKNQHAIDRLRKLFSYSLNYPIPLYSGDYNINHHASQSVINYQYNAPYLIFLHCTTHPKKHWPESYWADSIQYASNLNYKVKLPFWTSYEELRAKRLQKKFNHIILLPKLSLKQMANQMLQSKAIISVDTGLSHLAAALGCFNITLYGPTNPKLIGTYGHNQIILKSKTKQMQDLYPNLIWKKLEEKLT